MTEFDISVKLAVLEERVKALSELNILQSIEHARRLTDFTAELRAVQLLQDEYGLWRAKMIGVAIGSGVAGGSVVSMINNFF